jgi:hypothetical protein
MLKNFFLRKKKKAAFIIQVTEKAIKFVKYLPAKTVKFEAIGKVLLAAQLDGAGLTKKLNEIFKKLKFDFSPLIVSLPRIKVASRFLRVPARNPAEIGKIVSLQAPRYLPYPADELNTGFQIISTDKEGYSEVSLIIAHKEVIERYITALKEVKPSSLGIFLSSLGLCYLYQHCFPQEAVPAMLIDIDFCQAEVAILEGGEHLFSRSFKFTAENYGWENLFSEEVKKTRDLYLKEAVKGPPKKIILFITDKDYANLAAVLKAQMNLPVEEFNYSEKTGIPKELSAAISSSAGSFASLIGFTIKEIPGSLNLLPLDFKRKSKNISECNSRMRLVLSICALIAIFSLVLFMNFQNKNRYLKRLRSELDKISNESKPMEAIEKRFRVLGSRSKGKLSALDALYHLHKTTPEQVAINDFVYEEGNGVIIRGQAPELDYVFEFAARLRESEGFKKLDIKVKYATKKKTRTEEFVDFEIDCLI